MKIYEEEKPYWWDDNSGYGSHIYALQFIFEHIKVDYALEFGMGFYSTPFLLDNTNKGVLSIEMQEEEWALKVSEKYSNDKKFCCVIWDAIKSDTEDSYVLKCSNIRITDVEYDFVLSDGESFSRPLIVNHFMEREVQTIVGHDTESEWYGWNRVREDLGYYKYTFTDIAPYTTVWTKNENLIKALKERAAPKEKVVFLMQSFGLGDIIFCQEIANDFIRQGYKVLWGVEPHFVSIQKHFPKVTFIDKSLINVNYGLPLIQEVGNLIVYPLRFTDSLCKVPYKGCMKSKYLFFGKPWQKWRNVKNEMVRDTEKEKELFYNVLGFKDGEQYVLTSDTFKSNFSGKISFVIETEFKIVELKSIEGFSLIDWSMVIENATEIHSVSSSILYLLELLTLKTNEIHLYRRPTEIDFSFVEYIFTKNYKLHI
jgi:hypothetical protein